MQPVEIAAVVDKEAAWALLEEQPWSSRKKAQVRLQWKQRNDPSSIKKCPAKGRRYKDVDTISSLPSPPTSKEWWTWLTNFEIEYDDPAVLMAFRDSWEHRLEAKDKEWFLTLPNVDVDCFAPGMTGLHCLCMISRPEDGDVAEKLENRTIRLFHAMSEDAVLLRDDGGNTPFLYACSRERMEPVREYIEKFGKRIIDSFDNEQVTAFMTACWNGSLELAQFLYNRGADIDKKNMDGLTGMDWAREMENTHIVAFFEALPRCLLR